MHGNNLVGRGGVASIEINRNLMDSRPLSDEPVAQSMIDQLRNRQETGDGNLCDQIVSEKGRKVFR